MVKGRSLGCPERAGTSIDAELRDDAQRAVIPLAPQHRGRGRGASDGRIGRAVDPALQAAERLGVAPMDVLPGEEQRSNAGPPSSAQGVVRRHVVGLFVHVEEIGADVGQ